MTNNLKCPFCGAELRQYAADFWCKNPDCIIFNDIIHNKVIITDLIAGKKAQDALKIATGAIDILYDAIRHNNAKETCHIADYVLKFASEQRQILKEIITKQENE